MIRLDKDTYYGEPRYADELCDIVHWRQLDRDGEWSADGHGILGRWLDGSPSLFFGQRIEGDFLWQVNVRRLKPSEHDLRQMQLSKHWQNADPLYKYNYNFWLRADDPAGDDFLHAYPSKLGTGWNGMGDDYWHSLFSTIVWNPDSHWVRLRRSPGYVKECDVQDVVAHQAYDVPHHFAFAVLRDRVRMYWNGRRVYDWQGNGIAGSGYIGLCVWLCSVRFEEMKLYRLT